MKIINSKLLIIPLICSILFSGCYFIKQNDKTKILEAYTSEESTYRYYTFKAIVRSIKETSSENENNRFFEFDVDYNYFKTQYCIDSYETADGVKRWESAYSAFNHYTFWVDPSNFQVLLKNGGYDLLIEGADVLISANNYYGYNGWRYPILSLTIGEKIYLDFETGKANYLNYVKSGFIVN